METRVAKCTGCNFFTSSSVMLEVLDVDPTCPRCGSQVKFVQIESVTVTTNNINRDKPATSGDNW